MSVYYCEIFKFSFWVFCGGGVVSDGSWWLDFYGPKLFLLGTCWFHLCIELCSCRLGISSGRLCKFSEHLALDLLDTMSKDLMVKVPLKKTVALYFARVCLYCSLRTLMYVCQL